MHSRLQISQNQQVSKKCKSVVLVNFSNCIYNVKTTVELNGMSVQEDEVGLVEWGAAAAAAAQPKMAIFSYLAHDMGLLPIV